MQVSSIPKFIKIFTCFPSYTEELSNQLNDFSVTNADSFKHFDFQLFNLDLNKLPDVLILEIDKEGLCFATIRKIKNHPLLNGLIIILITNEKNKQYEVAKTSKVHDIYVFPINYAHLRERILFLVRFKLMRPKIEVFPDAALEHKYKLPLPKRMFDILFAGTLILLLLPLFIIIAIIIKIESKGPVIYKSKRVGTAYKIFDFYKFRSMRQDADTMIKDLSSLNQYSSEDGNATSVFVKLKNDPRVTRFGSFIRNTSLDELPQLFNILKGDMSTVGNRPLPLYEAEMLTTNEWSLRFMAPAGLTGLWQISKRGRADMSERERKKLDNFYAENYSLKFDITILLKTFPSLFQKEKV